MLEVFKKNKAIKYINCFLAIGILLVLFLGINKAEAASATLFLSPPSGNYDFGDTFSVFVKLNTGGLKINAAEGTLLFNPAELSVVSISKTGSIFTLWPVEPNFSNSVGNIVFGGGTPSNFNGTSGTIIQITFKSKANTTTKVNFSYGSVLAADGKGTNILATMSGGTYIVRSVSLVPPVGESYLAPVISSSTHFDSEKWYSNNNPEFSWKLSSDVTAVSVLLNNKPISNPGNISDGLLTSKKFEAVEDGTWYFHIKFKNGYGWGEITHRKVLIDTIPPTIFKVIIDKGGDLTNPSPILYFESSDVPSGIEYYEVVIDREEKIAAEAKVAAIADIKRNPFQMPLLAPGSHLVEVKAFDKAGNFSLTTAEVEITPIESPEITRIPTSVKVGDILEIEGKALSGLVVRIYLQKGEEEPILEKVKADLEGNFVLSYDKVLSKGYYLVWAQAENEKGALSNPTKKYALAVGSSLFLKFGKIAIDYLTIIVTLIVLIAGIVAIIFYVKYRISLWRKKMKGQTREASKAVYVAFKALRNEVQKEIENLDSKAGLTLAEKNVRNKLKEALDVSEKFISKEIKDIEEELK
ncbi:MAG TPA: cohesin domain-containing protein [Candidatus Paceibacterota bacterium]|nr:cohesin domain-containing protein [Candidatus Paceibacterota bacterium]